MPTERNAMHGPRLSRSFSHHIVGSEAGRPRPIAYMRAGRTRRSSVASSRRRGQRLWWALACCAMALLAMAAAFKATG